jgi:predicted ATPase
MMPSKWRLELHNIGPIKDACVELGPLAVLIGPNGSGKTILSSVAYAATLTVQRASLSAGLKGNVWKHLVNTDQTWSVSYVVGGTLQGYPST